DELTGGAGYLAGKAGLVPDKGYEYYRDYARGEDKKSQAANPVTYGASDLAGGLASAALIPNPTSMTGSIASGVGQGALMSAGETDQNLLSKQGLADVALGG